MTPEEKRIAELKAQLEEVDRRIEDKWHKANVESAKISIVCALIFGVVLYGIAFTILHDVL